MTTQLRSLAAAGLLSIALTGCAVAPPVSTAPSSAGTSGTSGASAPGTVSCTYRTGSAPAKAVDPPSGQDVPATGTTSVVINFGDAQVNVELDRAAAPCTVHSFESLAMQGYYDGSECHRLSTQGIFILQCGDPTGTGSGGPGYTYDDELEYTSDYPAGVLAMANAGPNTNGSQFFFVFEDTPLSPNYTVFGRLDEASNDVIAQRAFQGHDASNPDGTGRPNLPTVIESVTVG